MLMTTTAQPQQIRNVVREHIGAALLGGMFREDVTMGEIRDFTERLSDALAKQVVE